MVVETEDQAHVLQGLEIREPVQGGDPDLVTSVPGASQNHSVAAVSLAESLDSSMIFNTPASAKVSLDQAQDPAPQDKAAVVPGQPTATTGKRAKCGHAVRVVVP